MPCRCCGGDRLRSSVPAPTRCLAEEAGVPPGATLELDPWSRISIKVGSPSKCSEILWNGGSIGGTPGAKAIRVKPNAPKRRSGKDRKVIVDRFKGALVSYRAFRLLREGDRPDEQRLSAFYVD